MNPSVCDLIKANTSHQSIHPSAPHLEAGAEGELEEPDDHTDGSHAHGSHGLRPLRDAEAQHGLPHRCKVSVMVSFDVIWLNRGKQELYHRPRAEVGGQHPPATTHLPQYTSTHTKMKKYP